MKGRLLFMKVFSGPGNTKVFTNLVKCSSWILVRKICDNKYNKDSKHISEYPNQESQPRIRLGCSSNTLIIKLQTALGISKPNHSCQNHNHGVSQVGSSKTSESKPILGIPKPRLWDIVANLNQGAGQVGSSKTWASSVRRIPCNFSSSPTTSCFSIFPIRGLQLTQPLFNCLKSFWT